MTSLPPAQIVPEELPSELTGPFYLDPDILEQLDRATSDIKEVKLVDIDLGFLHEEIKRPTLSEARARIVQLSPPKPVEANSDLLNNRTNFQKRFNAGSPRQQDPIIKRIIHQMSSNDFNMALQVWCFFLCDVSEF